MITRNAHYGTMMERVILAQVAGMLPIGSNFQDAYAQTMMKMK